jgi:hypothetical protein
MATERDPKTEPAADPHPWYGPCDGWGPDGGCSECSGLVEHNDGSRTRIHDGALRLNHGLE